MKTFRWRKFACGLIASVGVLILSVSAAEANCGCQCIDNYESYQRCGPGRCWIPGTGGGGVDGGVYDPSMPNTTGDSTNGYCTDPPMVSYWGQACRCSGDPNSPFADCTHPPPPSPAYPNTDSCAGVSPSSTSSGNQKLGLPSHPWEIETPTSAKISATDRELLNQYSPKYNHSRGEDYKPERARMVNGKRVRTEDPSLRRTYGRVVRKGGRTFLQYNAYYYHNPPVQRSPNDPLPDLIPTPGEHEGDWEYVHVELDSNNRPIRSIYSRHGKPRSCPWEKVSKTIGSHPDVFVAKNSHAAYFKPGSYTPPDVAAKDPSGLCCKWDVADGQDPDLLPAPVDDICTQEWLNWDKRWGETRKNCSWFGIISCAVGAAADSPRGPKQQAPFKDPEKFSNESEPASECS